MKLSLHPDFKDFLKALNNHEVKYILVGGYAVIYYGYSRTTGVLDIWVEQTRETFQSLKKAFLEFGLPVNAIKEADFLQNKMDVYTFGVPPVCIEVITDLKGVTFQKCFSNALKVSYDSVSVNLINTVDLLENKKAVGRNKDLDDIEHLTDQ